jgi:hypothetical protein
MHPQKPVPAPAHTDIVHPVCLSEPQNDDDLSLLLCNDGVLLFLQKNFLLRFLYKNVPRDATPAGHLGRSSENPISPLHARLGLDPGTLTLDRALLRGS